MKRSTSVFCILVLLFAWRCNKNSLQLPDRQEDELLVKTLELNHVRVVELAFRQSVNELEGKTTLLFKNLSGISMTRLRVLIEGGNTSYADSVENQCIISIDTLHPGRDYTCSLPFPVTGLQAQRIQASLLSTGETSQLISGYYRNVYVAFEDRNKAVLKYGVVNGYITADGETRFRLKENLHYYEFTGRTIDTTIMTNGFLKKRVMLADSLAGPITLDTLQAAQRFDISGGFLHFRVKLAATLSDSTRYFSIKTQKQ